MESSRFLLTPMVMYRTRIPLHWHLRKLYKQCGLSKDYHLHTLRHFYATYLLQEGTSKQVTASLLGHADTAIFGAHLLSPAGRGETAGRKADARFAEQPKSVLCCIYEK